MKEQTEILINAMTTLMNMNINSVHVIYGTELYGFHYDVEGNMLVAENCGGDETKILDFDGMNDNEIHPELKHLMGLKSFVRTSKRTYKLYTAEDWYKLAKKKLREANKNGSK